MLRSSIEKLVTSGVSTFGLGSKFNSEAEAIVGFKDSLSISKEEG